MDKRTLLAILISFGIFVAWQKFYIEPYQHKAQEQQKQLEAAKAASQQREENKKQIDATGVYPSNLQKKNIPAAAKEESFTMDAPDYQVSVSNGRDFLNGWVLKNYTTALEEKNSHVDLGQVSGFNDQLGLRFNEEEYANWNDANWTVTKKEKNSFSAALQTAAGKAERRLTLSDKNYFADVSYKIHFAKTPPKFVFLDFKGNPKRPHDKEGSIFGQAPDKVHLVYRDANERKGVMADSLKENIESSAGIKWLGVDTKYFVLAMAPAEDLRKDSGVQITKGFEKGEPMVRGSFVVPTNGRQELDLNFKLYFGPKHLEDLNAADPILTDAIDFGWTSAIAIPMLKALKWLYTYVQNYGIAIILLTALIKMALFPLTYKSMKSMAKMAKLQPQLNALREKYKDDKEKLNAEMMNFMKVNGYNPVSGCLPILLQMPIFFALYRVFFNSMELYQSPFFGWIHDLSRPDPFFVTPVVLAGLMYLQQKLSPNTATDPTQQKMMQFMPLMFGVFMLALPAGLNVYMVVNSLVSIGQQYYLNKKFGITKKKEGKAAIA